MSRSRLKQRLAYRTGYGRVAYPALRHRWVAPATHTKRSRDTGEPPMNRTSTDATIHIGRRSGR